MTKIIGNTTATPNPQPDWNQNDSAKADYIKNKPEILTKTDVEDIITQTEGIGGTTVIVNGEEVTTFDADTKLDTLAKTGFLMLYAKSASGIDTQRTVATGTGLVQDGRIPQYWAKTVDYIAETEPTGKGVLVTSTPTRPFHTAPKKYVDDQISNVREVAEGKTKSFTIDTLESLGGLFSIDTSVVADEYVITTTTINYKDQSIELKQGDLFLIVDTSVPDYWVSVDDMKLYKMETTKVDLSEYAKNEVLDSKVDKTDETLVTESKEVIGAINELADNKLDKLPPNDKGITYCYISLPTGVQDKTPIQTVVVNNALVRRDNKGQIKVKETPEADNDATSKKYVDDVADTKLDKQIPTDYTSVPTIATDGTQGFIPVISGYPNPNTIPKRGTSGEILVNTHSAGGDFTATNKKYVHNLFNGANKAVSFVNYSAMITSLNTLDNTAYSVGQNVMIVTLNVPDLWVSEIAEESVSYEYVSDTDFTTLLETQGYVQVGYYKLSALETQKVDLSEYAKNEIVDGKLDKVTNSGQYNRLYGVAWDGKTQLTFSFYEGVGKSTIVQRDNSQIKLPETPVADNDATSKKYVDDIANTKLDKETSSSYYQRLYGIKADGEQKIFEIPGSRSAVINGRIPQYYANDFGDDTPPAGVLITGVPMKGCHATPKQYVDNKFNGANKAVSFNNYSEMIANLMAEETASYSVGQNIMIVTLNVPDLWVSGVIDDNNYYEYSSDEAFLQDLKDFESVPVGHYYLSALETQKVDLTEYAKLTATKLEDGSYSLALTTEE